MTGEELAGFIEGRLRKGEYHDKEGDVWLILLDPNIWFREDGTDGVLTTEQIMLKMIREELGDD